MEIVTDRTSNPFGLRAPCHGGSEAGVYGYGDPNGDVHLIGDYPGDHGGRATGVPFTGSEAGEHLQPVLHDVGFAALPNADEPEYSNLYASYRYMCPTPDDRTPTEEEYARLERYFDTELRAINAHVLLPVGGRPTKHVVDAYTTMGRKLELDMARLHASRIRGRGFMVVPIRDPADWADGDRERLVDELSAILSSDYRQTKGVATLVG
ncbi:MAG: uracil-DNA glycosylase family protein [Halobacteriales archaeon]